MKEDIQGITHADCVAFYELQYAAPDMIINVSPSFVLDQQELLDEGYRFVDRLPLLRTQWAPEPDAPQERVADVERDKTSLLYERFVAPEDAPVMMFLNEMMGAGLNSPLYSEVREKRGLVYSLDCCLIPLGASFVQHLYTVTSNENVAEVDAVVRMVLGKRDEFITAERLDMVRKSLQIRAEKNAINRFKFVDDLLTPENAAFAALVDTVSLVELHAAFDRYFYLDDYVRSADHEG